MPAIPIIQQQTLASQAGLPAGPNNLEGSGLEAVGRSLSATGAVLSQNEYRVRQQEIATSSNQALADLRLQTATKFSQAQQNAAPDVPNFTPDRLKEFDTDLADLTKSLDPQTQRAVRNGALEIRENLAQRSIGFEAQTRSATRGMAFDQATQKQAAAVELDPTQYSAALAQQTKALAGIEMDPIDRAKHAELARNAITEAAAIGIAKTDPKAALTALSAVKGAADGASLDISKYKLDANDPSANPQNWGKRADGTSKGQGFLGLLKRPDGKVSSELSIGVEINGKEVEIPTMVPTLTQGQLDYLMTNQPDAQGLPKDIRDKAVAFAKQRIAQGKSPFAQPGETPTDLSSTSSADPRFDNLTIAARQRVELTAKAQIVDNQAQTILDTYRNSGVDAGIKALAGVDKAGLPPDLASEVRAKVNAGLGELRSQRLEEHSDALDAIHKQLATDTAGNRTHAMVDNLWTVGALTPLQRASLHGAIDANIIEQAKKNAGAEEFNAAIASGLPLDPRNEVHRKGLAAAFSKDTTGVPLGSPSWQAIAVAYADRTRMLPDQATAWTRQVMRSPDPELAANGAQFLGAVTAASPDATSLFDTDTKAFAGTVNSMMEAGTNAARAVETARANVFEVKPQIVEARKSAYTSGKNALVKQSDGALKNFIGRDFGAGFFHSNPVATEALSTDFKAQAEQYYTKTGDIELARDLAWQDLKRVYGVTRVNGQPTISAFPVEKFGVTPEEVRKDVGDFLNSNPQPDGSTADDVVIVPDSFTLRSVIDGHGGQAVLPSYRLVGKSGDLIVGKDGIPKLYTVPGGQVLEAKIKAATAAAEAQAQQQVDQARTDREGLKVRIQAQIDQQDELH